MEARILRVTREERPPAPLPHWTPAALARNRRSWQGTVSHDANDHMHISARCRRTSSRHPLLIAPPPDADTACGQGMPTAALVPCGADIV